MTTKQTVKTLIENVMATGDYKKISAFFLSMKGILNPNEKIKYKGETIRLHKFFYYYNGTLYHSDLVENDLPF